MTTAADLESSAAAREWAQALAAELASLSTELPVIPAAAKGEGTNRERRRVGGR